MCSPRGWWDAAGLIVPGQLLCCTRLDSLQTELAQGFVQRLLMGQRWTELFPRTKAAFLSSFGISPSPAFFFLFGLISPLNFPRDEPVCPLHHLTVHGSLQKGQGLCWCG